MYLKKRYLRRVFYKEVLQRVFYEEDLKRVFFTEYLLRVFYNGGVYIRAIKDLLFKKLSSFKISNEGIFGKRTLLIL